MTELAVFRSFAADLATEDDGRTITGRCVPYGEVATVADGDGPPYRERWVPGAFRRIVRAPSRTMFNYAHREGLADLIGHAVGLEERPDGLHATFRALPGLVGDQALGLINSGVATGLSVNVWVAARGSRTADDGVVERTLAARLPHVALTPEPAYAGATVTAVRHALALPPEDATGKNVAAVLDYVDAARAKYAAS